MLCIPGSHRGPILDHHQDGYFAGAVTEEVADADQAELMEVHAGGISLHHVRTLHASAKNVSAHPRRLLLFQMAAIDAWPLLGSVRLGQLQRQHSARGPDLRGPGDRCAGAHAASAGTQGWVDLREPNGPAQQVVRGLEPGHGKHHGPRRPTGAGRPHRDSQSAVGGGDGQGTAGRVEPCPWARGGLLRGVAGLPRCGSGRLLGQQSRAWPSRCGDLWS